MLAIVMFLSIVILSPVPATAKTVLVLGDSLSAAYGIPTEKGWVHLMEQRLQQTFSGYNVVNASISGDTTRSALNRLPPLLKRHEPSVVIIEIGANDGLRGLPLQAAEKNIAGMIQQSRQHGSRVILIGMQLPPNYGPVYTKTFTGMYPRLARRYSIPLVPFLLKGFATDMDLMQSDGLHPNAEAQPLILDNVWPVLTGVLRGKT